MARRRKICVYARKTEGGAARRRWRERHDHARLGFAYNGVERFVRGRWTIHVHAWRSDKGLAWTCEFWETRLGAAPDGMIGVYEEMPGAFPTRSRALRAALRALRRMKSPRPAPLFMERCRWQTPSGDTWVVYQCRFLTHRFWAVREGAREDLQRWWDQRGEPHLSWAAMVEWLRNRA